MATRKVGLSIACASVGRTIVRRNKASRPAIRARGTIGLTGIVAYGPWRGRDSGRRRLGAGLSAIPHGSACPLRKVAGMIGLPERLLLRRNREDDDVCENKRERDEEAFVCAPRFCRVPRGIPVFANEGEQCLQEVEGTGGSRAGLQRYRIRGRETALIPVTADR